jgi:DNA-binding transcriptional LysR family regulator
VAAVNWDDLRVFQVLSEVGSLGKAAKKLGIDHSTVSRRLASLEEAMGAKLAIRNPSGLELTPAGEAVAAATAGMRELVDDVARRVGGEDERAEGVVRISVSPGLASFVLGGVPALRKRYPEIHVEVVARMAALDLVRREADVAIRNFREERASLITRKLGDMGWSLYASEDYLAKTGAPLGGLVLEDHEVIGYETSVSQLPGARWLNEQLDGKDPVMACGDPSSVRAAILAGIGVSVLPCLMAVGEARLRRLSPDVVAITEMFLVIPPDHKNTARVRVTLDHLVAHFDTHRDMLCGHANPAPN